MRDLKSEIKLVRVRRRNLWIIVPSARGSGQHTIGQPGRLHSGSDVFTEEEHLGLGRRTKTKKDKDAFKKGDIDISRSRCSAHHEDCHNTEHSASSNASPVSPGDVCVGVMMK